MLTDEWVNKWMGGWVNRWMDGRIDEFVHYKYLTNKIHMEADTTCEICQMWHSNCES